MSSAWINKQMNNGLESSLKYETIFSCCLTFFFFSSLKVKHVIVKLDDLIYRIKVDQKSRVKVEELLSIKIYNGSSDTDQSTTGLNGHFVHSLLLIDVLIRIKFSETDKQQLITLCKNQYKNNSTQLAIVREFEHEYTSNKALWWYNL